MSETEPADEIDEKDRAALSAIETLTDYLEETFITEGCRVHPSFGCASCQAVDLQRQLLILAASVRENLGIGPHF